MGKRVILEAESISNNIQRIAEQIAANNPSMADVVLIGIRTGGAYLAYRLQKAIEEINFSVPSIGIVDITLYRDDCTRIGLTPIVGKTELPFSLDDKAVILVDDVLFTGRTVRAAMDALMDYGRPRKIELAVLIDRGHAFREIPIMANYVGGTWGFSEDETVKVYLQEQGFSDHVAIEQKKAA